MNFIPYFWLFVGVIDILIFGNVLMGSAYLVAASFTYGLSEIRAAILLAKRGGDGKAGE